MAFASPSSPFRIVEGGVGFDRVNRAVLEKMRGWVLAAMEAAVLRAANAADIDDEMGLKMAHANLNPAQGKLGHAEKLFLECSQKLSTVS
jgi:hypothetical protein